MEALLNMLLVAFFVVFIIGISFRFVSRIPSDLSEVKCKEVKRYKFKGER